MENVDQINEGLEQSEGSSTSTGKRKTPSKVWDVFERLPKLDGERQKVKCKQCGSILLADSKSGTSSMRRHRETCRVNMIENSPSYPIVDHIKYREYIATAILMHNYPFSFVEHEGIRSVHKFLNPTVHTVSRNTTKADILKIYNHEKEKLKKELELVTGRICLTSDLWTSLTTDGYMSLTAHYVDSNWVLQKKILIFRHIPPPHSGQLLGEYLVQFLQEWGIDKKVFTITLDNASYQDGLVKVLRDHLYFNDSLIGNGCFLHVRCGAHVMNLIVQNGLKALDEVVIKIRESVKFVRSSQSRKLKFADCCRVVGLNVNKKVRQDVPTRWNSTYLMLDSAIAYRAAFHRLQYVDNQYKCFPSPEEWIRLEKIASLLKPFYEITTLFSGMNYPTANLYFPNVFKIQRLIVKHLTSEDEEICKIATFMLEKFQKYWDCYSHVLSLAIILDPRYKLHYVESVFKFLDPSTAENKLLNLKAALYSLFDEYVHIGSSDPLLASDDGITMDGDNQIMDDMDLEFELYENEHRFHQNKSQLDMYFEETLIPRNQKLNVLEHWKSNRMKWPELSLMARDILSIPITSVASESAFSYGGRIIDKFRSSIVPKNVEVLICTRDWLYELQVAREDSDDDDDEDGLSTDIQSLMARLNYES